MKFLLSFFFAVALLSLTAQVIEVSNPYKLPPKTSKFRIIGKNNDGIIVRLYGSEDVIDVFDESMRLVTTKNIDYRNKSGILQYVMLNKNGAVIFYLSQDKKYSVLLAQPVNSKFMEIGKPLVLDTIFDKRDMVASNLRFKASDDQSYLMMYYPYFSGSRIEAIKFVCVGRGAQTLYNKTVPINRNEKELQDSKFLVDNNGNSFMLLNPESKGEGNTYDVFRLLSSGDLSKYSITTQKALFGEPSFEIDNKNGNLVMCSFYNDSRNGEDVANGFAYASFDPANGTPLKSSYTPFSKDFITELTSREVSGKGRLYTFNIKKTLLRNDGGALMVAESFIKDTRETQVAMAIQPGFNSSRTSTVYQFNDILAFSINANADVEWHSIMRKKQASEDDNGVYSSFLTMNEKDKLRLMYLDDISTGGILNEYILTSEGKSERTVLMNQEEKEVMLLPKSGRQIAPNEIVIPSYLNGAFRLLKITF